VAEIGIAREIESVSPDDVMAEIVKEVAIHMMLDGPVVSEAENEAATEAVVDEEVI